MTIHKAKSSSYSTVTAVATVDYIEDYAIHIHDAIQANRGRLQDCSKTQLNAIAAELETVQKRLAWILEGKY